MTFPIDQWFDLSKPIPKAALREVEDEIRFRAMREYYPQSELKSTLKELKFAVRGHNHKQRVRANLRIVK